MVRGESAEPEAERSPCSSDWLAMRKYEARKSVHSLVRSSSEADKPVDDRPAGERQVEPASVAARQGAARTKAPREDKQRGTRRLG